MMQSYTELKSRMKSLVGSLPNQIFENIDEQSNKIITKSVQNHKKRFNDKILKYEDEIVQFGNKCIIAMIGNVNAGKSSLGNLLLGKEPSEVFTENSIRETSSGTIVDWGDDLLLDLPGLGFSVQDEKRVKDYIRRANILILVMGINSVIDKNLYQFILEEISKNDNTTQRLFIVMNKIDIYDEEYSYEEFMDEFAKVKKYTLNGDPNSDFKGIQPLFSYEINMVPFSVKKARKSHMDISLITDMIKELKLSTYINYEDVYFKELEETFKEFSFIEDKYLQLENIINNKKADIENRYQQSEAYLNGTKLATENINKLSTGLTYYPDRLFNLMTNLPKPNLLEKGVKWAFGAGNSFLKKKKDFDISLANICDEAIHTYHILKKQTLDSFYFKMKTIWEIETEKGDVVGDDTITAYCQRLRAVHSYFIDKFFERKDVQYNSFTYDAELRNSIQKHINTHVIVLRAKVVDFKLLKFKELDPLEKHRILLQKSYQEYSDIQKELYPPRPDDLFENSIYTIPEEDNSNYNILIFATLGIIFIIIFLLKS